MNRQLISINTIVVHCSDSDVPAHDDIAVIDAWHGERKPPFNFEGGGKLKHVGYHFFIKSNGQVQRGRSIDVVGAHVGNHNSNSIGICLHGKHPNQKAQFDSLALLLNGLRMILGNLLVVGHCDLDPVNKAHCPGFDLKKFLKDNLL